MDKKWKKSGKSGFFFEKKWKSGFFFEKKWIKSGKKVEKVDFFSNLF